MHTRKRTPNSTNKNAKILGHVALLLCYLPSNRPPPLIRTTTAAVNYTPPTATAASYQHRGRGLHHAVDLLPEWF